MMASDSTSVSYTHLDVYKRQGERSDMPAAVRRVILEVSETDAAVKTETN